MAKIMLVEDDNNLREIYQARLIAEGYETVAAKDGEEALAMAVKEKPDLIIADVMMPKISGFDMLDILRSTPETKNTKVVMMTALSEAEDRQRADKLGADRYLVKSQVTLEDVARTAREVLAESDNTAVPLPPPSTPTPAATPPADPATAATPMEPTTGPTDTPAINQSSDAAAHAQIQDFINQNSSTPPASDPPATDRPDSGNPGNAAATKINVPVTTITADPPINPDGPLPDMLAGSRPQHPQATPPSDELPDAETDAPVHSTRVIQPLNDINAKGPSIDELLEKEAAEGPPPPTADTIVTPGGTVMRASAEPAPGENPVQEAHEPEDNPTDLPYPPGHVITPKTTPQAQSDNVDPNSVAL